MEEGTRDISADSDVIIIGLESLRSDHFTERYFPECWNVFEQFAHFENAYANGVATPLSYHSIHTGHPIESDSALPENHRTIAECYDGYSFAISNNIHLLPQRGYNRGFDEFQQYPTEIRDSTIKTLYYRIRGLARKSEFITDLYQSFENRAERSSHEDMTQSVNRSAGNVLSIFGDAVQERPGLFWTHVFDTHSPFYPHKVLDRELDVPYDDEELRSMQKRFDNGTASDDDIEVLQNMYGELVRYVDRQLGAFLDRFSKTDRWDDATVIIYGDHGECFGEQGVFGHGWHNEPIDPLIHVPLVVKFPKGRHAGGQFSHPVQLGDIFVTLAEELDWNVETPPNTRPLTNPGTRPVISKSNTTVRVITADGSAVRTADGVETEGAVDEQSIEVLQDVTIPRADDLSGNIPGLDERERERVNQRLEDLGYR